MAKRVFEVVPDGERWKVVEKRGMYISLHTNKDSAVKDGHRVANESQPSQVVVRGVDGKIENEQSYGSDPSN